MHQETLISSLIDRGWYTCDQFLDHTLCLELIEELKALPLREAKIGKGQSQQLQTSIRNDSIFWLSENNSPLQELYLKKINDLMEVLNRELYLGLKQFEGHYARYDKGGFYKKHLDQFSGNGERLVTVITYLNAPIKGGELRIFKRNNPEEIEMDLAPREGSLVCFLSNQIYHEVRPTMSERFSITGWLRTTIL
ncbi:MAG: 2OG-Fe(II) oxygenase [Bacteriovorax sp.]